MKNFVLVFPSDILLIYIFIIAFVIAANVIRKHFHSREQLLSSRNNLILGE